MFTNNKEVLATDLSTFNMTKKTKFNGCFNQGEFEDLELYYFEGTKSEELDWSKDWDDTCEKIMIEINSLQDFINDEVRTYCTLMCEENNLIKIGFYDASPGMEGDHYEFTITNNENGEIVVSDLEMTQSGYLHYDEEDYDDDYDDDDDDDE